MWIWATIGSALLLGFYDVAKKQSLKKNGVLNVLFFSTLLSTLFLCPWLRPGSWSDELALVIKAVLVTSSWISGLAALKTLPLTTASTIKASRPVFVLLFSILLFHERLNVLQWLGSITVLGSIFLLSRSSRKEGISFTTDKGILYITVSVLTGVASALYDKHILAQRGLDPLFVQSWGNFFISVILGLCILYKKFTDREKAPKFTWDWAIALIAVCITIADALYFYALTVDGAMLSIISMVRRASVLVPFVFGALFFHEKNIRGKSLSLALLLTGMVIIVIGTV